MNTPGQNIEDQNAQNENAQNANTAVPLAEVPLAQVQVVQNGQTQQQELTKEALRMLFSTSSNVNRKIGDFQTLITQLHPGYDTPGKTITQLKSDILGILNETQVFSSLNRQMIRKITPLKLDKCKTTQNNKEFEDIKNAVNDFFSLDEPSENPLNNDNVGGYSTRGYSTND